MSNGTRFQGSDIEPPIDSLDEILDVTSEVLYEFGPVRSNTRIERMARFIAANLGGDPYQFVPVTCGQIERFHLENCDIIRFGETLGIEPKGTGVILLLAKSPAQGREVATAILRACELAERVDAPQEA